MALGILMLVLGVTIHGFDGDGKAVQQIELQKGQVDRLMKQIHSMESEFLEVKMDIKETTSISKTDPG